MKSAPQKFVEELFLNFNNGDVSKIYCVDWPYCKNGTPNHEDKRYGHWGGTTAHRSILEILSPTNNSNLQAAHTCHNPSCVNPYHLKWMLHEENQYDKANNKRETRKYNYLSKDQVIAIKERLSKINNIYIKDIAKEFGVPIATISLIKNNKIHKDV